VSPFQLVFLPFCTSLCVLTLWQGLRGLSGWRQSLLWATLWAGAGFLIAFPDVASVLAVCLGIGRGSDLVFYAAVLAGAAACLYFYQRYRRVEMLCTELLRREAIRQAERGGESYGQASADTGGEELASQERC